MFLQKCKMLIISSVNFDILGSPPDEGFSWNTARLSQQGSNHVKVYNKYSIGSIFQLHFFVHSFHRVLQSRMGLHNTFIGIIMFCPSQNFFVVKINKLNNSTCFQSQGPPEGCRVCRVLTPGWNPQTQGQQNSVKSYILQWMKKIKLQEFIRTKQIKFIAIGCLLKKDLYFICIS